jgi:hypothetical protein
VTLAGVALQRKPNFTAAFGSLAEDLRAGLPGAEPAEKR